MLNSACGNSSSISARITGRSENRICRWSGRGWTVRPLAPACNAMRPRCSRLGHGRSRRLRSMEMALIVTERKRDVEGKSVAVRVDLGGGRKNKKKNEAREKRKEKRRKGSKEQGGKEVKTKRGQRKKVKER